jgi:3'-phosphoadenosine 5'-phosphosulfate sulfotransferase (PAPS reductase)/FAD synthetase
MKEVNFINVSGGKDSTAVLLLALERQPANMRFIFADTGHEHPEVYTYLDYLDRELGIHIERVTADFTERLAKRRKFVEENWPEEAAKAALEVLHPSGSAFLDLALWKGRFPSTKARFCTEHLKREPLDLLANAALDEADRVVSWLGIRHDESKSRANAVEWQREFGPVEEPEAGLWAYRPILTWTALEVFDFLRSKGIKPNPLYKQGMGRVGCMPCINARKGEVAEIARRFPEEIDRVERWEEKLSAYAKRGVPSTLFSAKTIGFENAADIRLETHGIRKVVEWSKTAHGGKQFGFEFGDGGGCASVYGLCEVDDAPETDSEKEETE